MTWVKLDDQFPNHPKVDQVGPLASWLHVTALCHSSATLTDGFISHSRLGRLADVKQPEKLAQALVDAGMWDVVDGGWQIHDYLDYQPSAEKVRRDRAAAIDRKQKSREKSRKVSQRDTTVTDSAGRADAAVPPYPIPEPPYSSSSSPPTCTDPTPDDDWIRELAAEQALARLDEVRAAGRSVTKPDAWLAKTGAGIVVELGVLLADIDRQRPDLSDAQRRAAVAGKWGTVTDLCGVCELGWVPGDNGVSRCVACSIPDGVLT